MRIDQRKLADKFPALELPVASFVEFLSEYVKVCVGHHQSVGNDNELEADLESSLLRQQESDAIRSAVKSRQQRPVMVPERNASAELLKTRPSRVAKKPPVSDPKTFRPKSLQHVQSKIKPQLDARREKLLRVKTTQTQLMKESLARARLAEYEAKRMLDTAAASGSRSTGGGQAQRVRKMPLADITAGTRVQVYYLTEDMVILTCVVGCLVVSGAAALEIADNFMKSPLLDSFSGKENRDERNRVNVSPRKGPLREELYGAASLDDSFLGCKPPRINTPVTRKPEPKKPSRGIFFCFVALLHGCGSLTHLHHLCSYVLQLITAGWETLGRSTPRPLSPSGKLRATTTRRRATMPVRQRHARTKVRALILELHPLVCISCLRLDCPNHMNAQVVPVRPKSSRGSLTGTLTFDPLLCLFL